VDALVAGIRFPEYLPGLALAGAIGLLIGFERGWELREEPAGQRVAGIPTFAMLGCSAGCPAWWGATGLSLIACARTVIALLAGYAFDMCQSLMG